MILSIQIRRNSTVLALNWLDGSRVKFRVPTMKTQLAGLKCQSLGKSFHVLISGICKNTMYKHNILRDGDNPVTRIQERAYCAGLNYKRSPNYCLSEFLRTAQTAT